MYAMLEQILVETGSAYLHVDSSFCIRRAGGHTDILNIMSFPIGGSLFDLLPELVGNEALLQAILAGHTARLQVQRINRDEHAGSTRYFDLLTLPHTDERGRIEGLIQVITDVTERGLIEQTYTQQRNELRLLKDRVTQQNIELARSNAELRYASRLKDEFLAGISHEVRTPLSAILGMAELLHAPELGDLNAEQTDILQRIEESGHHLLTVINDLLDLARIEAGQLDLDVQPISIHQLCDASVRMVNQLARRKSQVTQIEIDPHVSVLHGDERRLRQVLINLLANAIKFTPPGGTIGIDVSSDADAETVHLTVWDTGIGIAPEDMPHLFQPFSQIDNVYQREQAGSGLGLVMVARLIELHRGSVSLTSKPGVGSRFTISLPWTFADQQRQQDMTDRDSVGTTHTKREPPHEPEPLPHVGDHENILLIEDDRAGALVVSDYLRRCGYRVTHAISRDEAFAYVRQELPQLMIVDVRMRGVDGLELIRQMRSSVTTRATPIIVLTALAMPGMREQCLDVGANVYVSKPVSLRRLVDMISMLLGSGDM